MISTDTIIKLYEVIKRVGHGNFNLLQKESKLRDTELCLSICSLIRDNKVRQYKKGNTVIYEFVI